MTNGESKRKFIDINSYLLIYIRFEQSVSHEFSSDEDVETRSYESNKRLHNAEQHRLNADTAFKFNNYQGSIDLYTKSISLEPNLLAYINRAIACMFKLNFH